MKRHLIAVITIVSTALGTGRSDHLHRLEFADRESVDHGDAPKPLPNEIVKEWKDAGADFGWMRLDKFGYYEFFPESKGARGDLPVFRFLKWKEGVVSKLTAPKVAFGLDFSGARVTDAGLKELVKFAGLRFLNLEGAKVTDAGLKEVATLKELETLNLGFTRVTDTGLEELSNLKSLRSLYLYATKVSDTGTKHLTKFAKMERLFLQGTKVTDTGLKQLTNLTELQLLDVGGNEITDTGLKELARLKKLRDLYLIDVRSVTKSGLDELREALPDCNLHRE